MVPSVDNGRSRDEERTQLQTQLLSAVKSCQTRFGGRAELATELDPCVANLCLAFEQVLCHGLKPHDKVPNALRQVTDLVLGSSEKFTLWDVIQNQLTSHEKERYELLRQIWTNRGRGRAWLRSAINERSLERYLTSLVSLPVLKNFYEEWAFILDPELCSILPNAAAGLSSILFALSIDRPELNQSGNEDFKVISESETVIEEPEPGKKKEDKKNRKSAKNIISFGDEDLIEPSASNQTEATIPENVPVAPIVTSVIQVDEDNSGEIECAVEAAGVLDQDLFNSDNESKNGNEHLSPNPSSGLRLLSNSMLGDLIPVMPNEEHSSEDSISVPSCSEEGETSSSGAAADRISYVGTSESNETPDLEALIEKLEKMSEANCALTSQLTQTKMDHRQKVAQYEQKLLELQKENESLRGSLKKFVSAVQLLKQEGTDFQGEELYQQKLVQVAEMHGELMELNDRLQRNMVSKDIIIKRLYLELEALRGPLGPPEIDISTQFISLWVPSVFLSGSPRTHHVYQIHLRIGLEEWNVYRRYSEFYDLHQENKKLYPVISAFQFPPKKTIGNKDSKFVDDRRLKLQLYLRRLVNHLVANNTQLSASASKASLTAAIPFFAESRETPSRSPRPRPPRISTSPQYQGL